MSDSPETFPPKHVRHTERQFEEIRGEIEGMQRELQREMQELRQEMKAGFDRVDSRLDKIDTRLHNIQAREKNEDAYLCRVEYVPLLKADGTTIANFRRNSEAVEDLDSQTIDAPLTDLGVDFQGRELFQKKCLFYREIGVKIIYK